MGGSLLSKVTVDSPIQIVIPNINSKSSISGNQIGNNRGERCKLYIVSAIDFDLIHRIPRISPQNLRESERNPESFTVAGHLHFYFDGTSFHKSYGIVVIIFIG